MRATLADITSLTESITMAAYELGMVTDNETVEYSGGSVTNGIAARIYVRGTLGAGMSVTYKSFLPEFNYKQSKNDHYTLLLTTLKALYGVLEVQRQK